MDAEGNEAEVGKTLHWDKSNYVIMHGIDVSKKQLQLYTEKALDAVAVFGSKNAKLMALCSMLLNRKT